MFRDFKNTAKKNKNYRKNISNLARIESESESESPEKSPLDYPITAFNFDKSSQTNTEVDDLALSLSQIDIQSPNMPNETNFQQLRLFLDTIPTFNGDPCELNNFLAVCNETFVTFQNENESIKKLIFRGIIGKLKGKALTLISSRLELDTWEKVREVLRVSFSDQRSFNCLLHELHSLRPYPRENSYTCGVRCQYVY